MTTDHAALIARIDAWDRCYPGNCSIELLVDDCRAAIEALLAERDELLRERIEINSPLRPLEALLAERDALREALAACVAVAKAWHNMDGSDVWDIYYEHSPEMKPIRAALDAARREER